MAVFFTFIGWLRHRDWQELVFWGLGLFVFGFWLVIQLKRAKDEHRRGAVVLLFCVGLVVALACLYWITGQVEQYVASIDNPAARETTRVVLQAPAPVMTNSDSIQDARKRNKERLLRTRSTDLQRFRDRGSAIIAFLHTSPSPGLAPNERDASKLIAAWVDEVSTYATNKLHRPYWASQWRDAEGGADEYAYEHGVMKSVTMESAVRTRLAILDDWDKRLVELE